MPWTATDPKIDALQKEGQQEVCVDCQLEPQPSQENPPPADAVSAEPNSTPKEEQRKPEDGKENLMDPQTFIPPLNLTTANVMPTPLVVIEYCQRCKFGLRANWIQQELLSTFAPIPPSSDPSQSTASVASIIMIPKVDDISAGRFRIYLLPSHTNLTEKEAYHTYQGGLILVWDRKVQAGFPEMRILKQKIRDIINPDFALGHSDKP